MLETTTSSSKLLVFQRGNNSVHIGIGVILGILIVAAGVLFYTLPDANAFNDRVEQLFVENNDLTSNAEIQLLEILGQ